MSKLVIDNKELMLDWDWAKNNEAGLDPNILTCGINKTAHWKCHICGNEWTTRIQRKSKGARCKMCVAQGYTIAPKEKSLATLYPKIAEEWDYELNATTPDKIYPQSNLPYHWRCSLGHKWKDSAAHRVTRGNSCPYCSNHRVLIGFNDLKTTHPHLLDEWDYEYNDKLGIHPTDVTYGSKKEVFWKCKRGHNWKCAVYIRTTNNQGCPHCSKELRTSFPEKIVAYYISGLFDGCEENYHSKDLDRLELDIFIPSLKVGIEYDGVRWHKNIEKDKAKDLLCEKQNISVFRIREEGCPEYESNSAKISVRYGNNKDLSIAISSIIDTINKQYNLTKTADIDIERDSAAILSKALSQIKENSIANSPLIDEWDWEKNKDIDPSLIPAHSNKKFWWRCNLNHSWFAQASKRSFGRKCPYCSGQRVLKGFNDLESQYPDVAKEWDFSKNTKRPDEVTSKSNKKYWWVCSKCGHNWLTTIYVRTGMGCGCPECKKKKLGIQSRRKVKNLDTGETYVSLKQASLDTGINQFSISNCCRGKTRTAGKYHWAYID